MSMNENYTIVKQQIQQFEGIGFAWAVFQELSSIVWQEEEMSPPYMGVEAEADNYHKALDKFIVLILNSGRLLL